MRCFHSVVVVLLMSASVFAATKTITSVGEGETKELAKREALRKAVEQGAGTLIASESQTKDFTLVRDTVLAKASGFVKSYDVLSAKETSDGLWMVRLRAVVDAKSIDDTWAKVALLLKEQGRPKIMLHVIERIDGKIDPSSTLEAMIENKMLKYGFAVVDKDQLKEIERRDLDAATAEDNAAKLQAVAKRFGAQVFVSGYSNASWTRQTRIYGTTLQMYECDADVKVRNTDTGAVLSRNVLPDDPNIRTGGVRGRGRSRVAGKIALKKAGKALAPLVIHDVLKFWSDAYLLGGEIILDVDGVSFSQASKILKALKAIQGVEQVSRKYNNRQARFTLVAKMQAETLAERVDTGSLGGVNLEVTDLSANRVQARVED